MAISSSKGILCIPILFDFKYQTPTPYHAGELTVQDSTPKAANGNFDVQSRKRRKSGIVYYNV